MEYGYLEELRSLLSLLKLMTSTTTIGKKVDINNEQDKQFSGDIWAWSTENNWGGRGEFISGRSWGC